MIDLIALNSKLAKNVMKNIIKILSVTQSKKKLERNENWGLALAGLMSYLSPRNQVAEYRKVQSNVKTMTCRVPLGALLHEAS